MRTCPSPLWPKAVPGTTATCSLAQQALAELLGRQAGRLDGREHIERALRLKALQAHRAQLAEQKAAAQVVLRAHALDVVLAGADGLDARKLRGRRRGHDAELVHLADVAHELLGAHRPAETPAGHGVGLGEAVHHDGALLHARQLGEADVRRLAVGQAAVDLVRQHDDVGLADAPRRWPPARPAS